MSQHYQRARQISGATALRVLVENGADVGTEKLKGAFVAFTIALIAVLGRERVYQILMEVFSEIRPQPSVPYLVISNEDVA